MLRNLTGKRIQVDEIWNFVYAKNDNVKHAKAAPADAGDVWTWTAIDADTKLLVSWLVGDALARRSRELLASLVRACQHFICRTAKSYYTDAYAPVYSADKRISKKIENHACAVALHSMYYNFVRLHQTLKVSSAMAGGVTDRLWEMVDVVDVLDAFEARRKRTTKPQIVEIVPWGIGGGYFVRATLPDGTIDRIEGFVTEADAGRWIRNDSTAYLHSRRSKTR